MCCPISQDFMEDPVIADDQKTYNRAHIEAWFAYGLAGKGHCDSPWTRQKVSARLRPDTPLIHKMDADPALRLHRQNRLAKRVRASLRQPTPSPPSPPISDAELVAWRRLGVAGAGLLVGTGGYALWPMLAPALWESLVGQALLPTARELRAEMPLAAWSLGGFVGALAAQIATNQLAEYGRDTVRPLRAWAAAYAGAGGALGAVVLVPTAVRAGVDLAVRAMPQVWTQAWPPQAVQATGVALGMASGVLLARSALEWAKRTVLANIVMPTEPLRLAG